MNEDIEPKKQINRERNHQIKFRVNDDEKEYIEQKIELSGLKNNSLFYRKMIIEGQIIQIDFQELKEHTQAIGRIGANINQLVSKANSINYFDLKDIEEIRKKMSEIWNMENEILQFFLDIMN